MLGLEVHKRFHVDSAHFSLSVLNLSYAGAKVFSGNFGWIGEILTGLILGFIPFWTCQLSIFCEKRGENYIVHLLKESLGINFGFNK